MSKPTPAGELAETKKRRREKITILFIGLVFCILTYAEIQLSSQSQKLPLENSIFFFGLINFNIILLLFLTFLLFRNIVKLFSERRGGMMGSSLRTKLVLAFTSFSFVPTILLFLVSVFYINSSFDKWFSIKIGSALQDSIEVSKAYYDSSKKKNYHFAHLIAQKISETDSEKNKEKLVRDLKREYLLDVVEIYTGLFDERKLYVDETSELRQVPAATLEFLQKGLTQGVEYSTIHQFSEGNLIRCIVPIKSPWGDGSILGAVVVSSYIPLSLVNKMDVVALAFEGFKDVNPLKYPIKSIYMIILILVTLIIFFGASWFGFHLARQLATPLMALGDAAKEVALGKYRNVEVKSGSDEIAQLVDSFNTMTKDLRHSQENLRTYTRYIEIVLSNISAGVISVDKDGNITTINNYAAELLSINPNNIVGRHFNEVLNPDHKKLFLDLVAKLRHHRAHSIQRELKVNVKGEQVILQVTMSPLRDEKGGDLGMVLVFDDLTDLVTAQRSAAWREVARRIAHEIKNPLTPIKLSAERLAKKFGETVEDPTFAECTSTIIKQVDTLRDLVNEFSTFARLPHARLAETDLNELIGESLPLYKQAHSDVEFVTQLDSSLPKVSLDSEQIKRVLVNLFENAVAALEGVGQPKVEISTSFIPERKMAKIVVSDNGVGISEEVRARIFEPYFSTKKDGTGLGLAIVRRIIDDHQGTIRAHKNVPEGTRFVIEIPIQPAVEIGAGTENILKT